MQNTVNYNLKKPESNEFVNVDDINGNMDIIDEQLKNIDNSKVTKIIGKGLSTNDYTTAEKEKLATLNNYDDSGLRLELDKKADKTYTDAHRTYTLTHTKVGTVHTLSDLPTGQGIYQCQFIATADYTEGDTFTDYTAKPTGEETILPNKVFVTGDLVSFTVDTVNKKLGFKIGGGDSGKKYATIVIGTSLSGYTDKDVDYLCDGTNDDIEINQAINALSANGGEIKLLDGIYNITSNITIINKNNILLNGSGDSTVLKRMFNAQSTSGLINATDSQFIVIKNIKIDGNRNNYQGNLSYGMRFVNCVDCTIENNTIINNQISIQLVTPSSKIKVINNLLENNSVYGIHITEVNYCTIQSNRCINNAQTGIAISTATNCSIIGNMCTGNNSNGMYLQSLSNCIINNNNCSNNRGTASNGIYLITSSHTTVTGNTVNLNTSFGMYISQSAVSIISGNVCNLNKTGIHIGSLGARHNSVTGNECNGNSQYGINISDTTDNLIVGNYCLNSGFWGIGLSNASRNCIVANTCMRGTGTSGDYTASTENIFLNGSTNDYNLIAYNYILGKNYTTQGGTGNTFTGNKYN